ncbi:hypothetical protein [Urbifossiella limnaea]|uniref:Uncharacterized protein n=1 Tax=Urbifossiella limnaea TaxID=2528023 RepID=A0A517XXL5_9BACT|nr:hypothetical protein [Urbifossiella limnaea]QDU22258.1 hypothetical protein ETAA1_42350 [Urbifossiella limnaea]
MIAAVFQVHPRPPRPVGPRTTARERVERLVAVTHYLLRALTFAALAILTWLVTSRRGRYVLCAVAVVGCFRGYSAYRESVLAAERERLVLAVEAFRTAHGRYPVSLEEAGIAPNQTLLSFNVRYGSEPASRGPWLELEQDSFISPREWEYDFRRSVWHDY